MTGLRSRLSSLLSSIGSRKSQVASGVIGLVAFTAYQVAVARGTFSPGSVLGVTFGVAAVAAVALVMLYSVRRGLPRLRGLGPRKGYMQLHLWGGLLFLLLVLLHTGFQVPAGVLTFTLWAVSLWVVLTGVVGLALQRTIPRLLGPTASFEVHLHRIPELVEELRERAEEAVTDAEPRVRTFYEKEFAPAMAEPQMLGSGLLRRPEENGPGGGAVEILRKTLPEEGATTLERLRELRQAKHEMDVHFTLQRVLRGWLYLHLPVAIILLGLVVLHIFFVLYF